MHVSARIETVLRIGQFIASDTLKTLDELYLCLYFFVSLFVFVCSFIVIIFNVFLATIVW